MTRSEHYRTSAKLYALFAALAAVITLLAIIGAFAAYQAENGFMLAGAALGTAAALSWTILLADKARNYINRYLDLQLAGTSEKMEGLP